MFNCVVKTPSFANTDFRFENEGVHGVKRVRILVYFRIQSECGKNANQNNSEYGHFLRSGIIEEREGKFTMFKRAFIKHHNLNKMNLGSLYHLNFG